MNIKQIQRSRELHAIDEWGNGYFGIDMEGRVVVHPTAEESAEIPLIDIVAEAEAKGAALPMILRFPQAVKKQIQRMHTTFSESVWEYNYKGKHYGVFPFKVNQRKEFIDAVVSSGEDFNWGLEVGSKTELMAAMSYKMSPDSLLICNGFKDGEFIEMAFMAAALDKKVILVVEGPDELELIINQLKQPRAETVPTPDIGMRVRLYSKGSGKWEKSSGETSKFGLTSIELLHALEMMKDEGICSKLKMLHFHIGSQITAIKRFKSALKEAARVFTRVSKMGFDPEFLNIGGGVGVDYDGSKTSAESSANYSMQEFANDAVYVIGGICDEEKIAHPHIVTESGRVIAAYHSVVVVDIREVQGEESLSEKISELAITNETQRGTKNLKELRYIDENINKKNFSEYYHDATQFHEELFSMFTLGYLSLEERAVADELYQRICHKALYFATFQAKKSEEFENLQRLKVSKYLANFSIFQSIPDSWAIGQLFPVVPLSRHDENPSVKATIVDITCDSDGCLDRFIDQTDEKNSLDLHSTDGEPYLIGFFLVGAYQESLANEHNLFGAIHEADVVINSDGEWAISKITMGDPIDELLAIRNYERVDLMNGYKEQIEQSVAKGKLPASDGAELFSELDKRLSSYPYLKRS